MRPFSKTTTRRKIATAIRGAAAALLCVAALCQPHFAYAARGGGGGYHGGGFHAGALHAGGLHGGFAIRHNGFGRVNERHWYHGWHGGRNGWWLVGPGLAWIYYSYPGWGYYPDYGYYDDYGQPSAWYYCADPQGYYPYVPQCNSRWETVPPS